MSNKIIIIGAGPGGYVLAEILGRHGLKVTLIDKSQFPGGTCLNIGCIPSKALLQSSHIYSEAKQLVRHGISATSLTFSLTGMMSNKNRAVETLGSDVKLILKKSGVDYINDEAKFLDLNTIELLKTGELISCNDAVIVLAMGSSPMTLSSIEFDEERILSSTGALSLKEVPEHLVIVGAGVIGLELGSVWARLGSKVTFIEAAQQVLPSMDQDVAVYVQKQFEKEGMTFKLGQKVSNLNREANVVTVTLTQGTIEATHVLIAIGRKAKTTNLPHKIKLNAKGEIIVEDNYKLSGIDNFYAIGDMIEGPMLAHRASDDAQALANFLITGNMYKPKYHLIPNIVYTHPEVASVGYSELSLKSSGKAYKVGRSNLRANARALISGDEGFVKLIVSAEEENKGEILGASIISPSAGEMIGEIVALMNFRATAEDITLISHGHPTLSESLKLAALSLE